MKQPNPARLARFFGRVRLTASYCTPQPSAEGTLTIGDLVGVALPIPRGPEARINVEPGQQLQKGQPLGTWLDSPVTPSPWAGEVAQIEPVADLRGGEARPTVWLRPTGDDNPAFPPLNIEDTTETLWSRVVEAGLAAQLPKRGTEISPVLLAADADADVSSTQALLAAAPDRAVKAAALLGRLFASKAVLAVADAQVASVETAAAARGVTLLPLGCTYPQRLPRAVAAYLGTADGLFPLRRALAILEVIEHGTPPGEAWVDVYDGEAFAGTWRVPVGIKLRDLLAGVGIEPTAGDCVIVGGALRGFAQHSLDAPVDYETDAIRYLSQPDYREWSDSPCVNCGSCVDVCPVALQVHMIGRLAEFGRFEDTVDHHLDACLDCGLCAMACPAHRPLLQWIRLAREENRSAGEQQ